MHGEQNNEEQENGKNRFGTDRWLQRVAWILAISSFLFLVFHSLPPLERTIKSISRSTEFIGNLSALSSQEKGSFLKVHLPKSSEDQISPNRRIPKIIHQTFKNNSIPEALQNYVRSWKNQNPTWQYRFYNDSDCLDFVRREFPEYLSAYQSLPKNIERADFFRYMVVLRSGGVYADLDTESIVPLDQFLFSDDALVVGWECDMPSIKDTIRRNFVRQRQILQWIFAAAPGHPVLREVCDFIAQNVLTTFSNDSTKINTLEKTGPGIWTDTILRHLANSETRHRIRILPQVAFGVHPHGTDNLHPDCPGILVQHHFLGSWKGTKNIFSKLFGVRPLETTLRSPPMDYFPVSIHFVPPFTIMVHPNSEGPKIADSDVSLEITLTGLWQAGIRFPPYPNAMNVVAGSLGNLNMNLKLIDIGAGLGLFSLSAAAKQHPVIAFESTRQNLDPFKQSIHVNNFTHSIQLFSSIPALKDALNPRCLSPKPQLWPLPENTTTEDCPLEVGVIRVGDSGWSVWKAINGTDYILRLEPEIVIVEFSPWRMVQAGFKSPLSALQSVVELGYEEAYHSGRLCERRWQVLSKHVPNLDQDQKPSWCNVALTDFSIFQRIDENERTPPENVLFVKRKRGAV